MFAAKHLNNRNVFIWNNNRCFQGFCVSTKVKACSVQWSVTALWQWLHKRKDQTITLDFADGPTTNATISTALRLPSHSCKYQMHRKRKKNNLFTLSAMHMQTFSHLCSIFCFSVTCFNTWGMVSSLASVNCLKSQIQETAHCCWHQRTNYMTK